MAYDAWKDCWPRQPQPLKDKLDKLPAPGRIVLLAGSARYPVARACPVGETARRVGQR